MKFRYCLMFIVLLLSACTSGAPQNGATPSPETTVSGLPDPVIATTSMPSVKPAAQAFLDAWKAENYELMYGMLTPVTKDAISLEDFTNRYKDVAINLTLSTIETEIMSTMTVPKSSQAAYRVVFHTALVGDIVRETTMNLSLENNQWLIQWEDGMIMPELRGGNRLAMDIKIPARANIYDANGTALAAQSEAVALGIDPSQLSEDYEGDLFSELANITGKTFGEIETAFEKNRGTNWYVGVGEASLADVESRYNILANYPGLVMNNFTSRYYFDGGLAPHVTGYVQSIFKEELDQYRRLGYRGDEKVGQAGLEKWGEQYLAGGRGASLYVTSPDGSTIITRLAQADPTPSQAIYTTIDAELQEGVQKSLNGFRGAAVVMERDTGRILAMTSTPGFDPNLFEPGNYNSGWMLGDEVLNNDQQPLVNRATQGGYPLGSVFKIVTMAAALESGVFTPESTYDCQYIFNETGRDYEDWTLAHEVPPSGMLTLPEGLMRSCNPWFYHIGLDLYRANRPNDLTEMAKGFGLGSATGIEQVAEDSGNIPEPTSEDQAIQMGIGQSTILVTPLQVVNFIAAVGNGGTLYRPQIIEKIQPPEGDPTFTFQPEERGKLPVSPENLQVIQAAMRSVVEDKRGTAFRVFTGFNAPVYGKTGTAQTGDFTDPHAWFAGYTDSQSQSRPNVAVVVIVENQGEGSEWAAPIFRRILEYYYDGKPGRLYPWESSFFVTETPTPIPSDTPLFAPTDTPQPESESGEPEATMTPIGN